MFTHVLVGIDDGEGGRDAIALAGKLVAAEGKITLAYVHGGYPLKGRGASPVFEAVERRRAADVLAAAVSEAGIDADVASIGSSSIGRGLHTLAEATAAQLLVVGSSRRSTIGRVLMGDDTRSSLNGAPCAVAIAPLGYATHPTAMREIGVAYDQSPESEHALHVARAFAQERGAKLSCFQAVELPTYAYLGGPASVDMPIEEMLEQARRGMGAVDIAEAHVVYGQPAAELTVYSASVDLLVIGSRGYGPLGRLVHGSTTRQLMRSARCPLVVLTRASRETDAASADLASGTERHTRDTGVAVGADASRPEA